MDADGPEIHRKMSPLKKVAGTLIMSGAFLLEIVDREAEWSELPLLGKELVKLWLGEIDDYE